MKFNFGKAFVELFPQLLHGLGTVVYITLLGFGLAVLMALLIALGRLSKKKGLNGFLVVVIEIIRGTPLLVQFFYIYYVFPMLGDAITSLFGVTTHLQISAPVAGIVGFMINYGCYMSEVIRSSILSIDPGQREAGLALGYTERQVLFKFIVPPAIRNVVPTLGNYLVMMVKDTSLLAMISVAELLFITKAYASQTFLTVEAYTIVALLYLLLSLPLSRIVAGVEKHLNKQG